MIFCEHCKHRDEIWCEFEACGASLARSIGLINQCATVNKYRDCRDYSPKFWARIFHRRDVKECLETLEYLKGNEND